jgi:hypothetical protein
MNKKIGITQSDPWLQEYVKIAIPHGIFQPTKMYLLCPNEQRAIDRRQGVGNIYRMTRT